MNLLILQWNIQGYCNNKHTLERLIAKYKPDIIALQETHIISKSLHLFKMKNYKSYHFNKNYDYSKAGIGFLVRENVPVTLHITSSSNLLHHTIEIPDRIPIKITNIYREHDVQVNLDILNRIPSTNDGCHHFLLGDLIHQIHNSLWGSDNTNSLSTLI